jgi:hypothetical protein
MEWSNVEHRILYPTWDTVQYKISDLAVEIPSSTYDKGFSDTQIIIKKWIEI